MATINRGDQQTAEQKIVSGLQKHEADLTSIVLAGTSYKTADIITIVQGLINSAQLVLSNRATWQASIVADENERAKNKPFMSGLRAAIRAAYGGSIDVLADFGLTPRKIPAVRTPQEKAEAAAKAKATRAARHTMGSKQKALITGTSVASQPSGDTTKVPAPAPVTTPAPTAPSAPVVAPASPTTHS
jgi:hypothetical protein